VRIVGAGLDRKSVHRCGRAVLGAPGAQSRRGRRSHRATALDGFMIKATVVIIESIRRNDQEVHAQAAKPFEHWHGLLQ
jgi:hypothetical protein